MNDSYNNSREDFLLFSGIDYSNLTVLDFGCYRGANAEFLKKNYSNVYYVGVEKDKAAINSLSSSVDKLFEIDLDFFKYEEILIDKKYDVVILGDVIEHLKNPDIFLNELSKVIDKNTIVLVSIPNIQFYETFFLLMNGRFPRRDRGIFDKTHLRFFTKYEFLDMLSKKFKVNKFERKFRLIEKNSEINKYTNYVKPILFLLAPFFTFQMYFSISKIDES